jgi:hypothetical protein
MIQRSPGGTSEAPVLTGRAPRRVPAPAPRRSWRAVLVVTLTVLAGLTLAPAASAHEASDPELSAVLDTLAPEMPGVSMTVQTTRLGSQFVLENPTPTEVTILSSVGDPLFRVGPEGVLGNFRSPEWYTSKVPGGAVSIPEKAAEKGRPVWVRVSDEPAWGWFDHRLHAANLDPEQKAETAPLEAFGTWSVPLKYGEALGSVDGHFEYRPSLGQFTPTLSETQPAPGVTLTALQGNPTPGVAIDNAGPSEVVVLGAEEEPYLRITPNGTEANQLSPTWVSSQDPSAVAGSAADPAAPPQWVPVGTTGQYSFTLERASPDQELAGLYALSSPTVVREWTVSLLVDGERIDVAGETTMTPAGYQSGWGFWAVAGLVLAALVVAAAVVWFLRRRAAGRPQTPPADTREKVGSSR